MRLVFEQVNELLTTTEGPKLDFKSIWYKDGEKNELVKDIISLANGSINSLGQYGFLIIGLNEKSGDLIDILIKDPKGNTKTESQLKDEITQLLKNFTGKPLNFHINFILKDGKNLIFIVIEPHPYLIYLTKDLDTKTRTFSKGALIYRENSIVEVASKEIVDEFEKRIVSVKVEELPSRLSTSLEQPEIKIEAKDILNLIISPRDIRNLSEEIVKSRSTKVYYEYFSLERRGLLEGYLFLGSNATRKNVFDSFCSSLGAATLSSLEIFLVKKRDGQRVTDQKTRIYELLSEYGLRDVVGDNVHYIDDFIWENTNIEDISEDSFKRNDFIDQKLYKLNNEKDLELLPEESVEFFIHEINRENVAPFSVVFGSGGVGKTTFCDTLKYALEHSKESRRKVFYIKGERIAQFFASENKEIRTLDDLYDFYKEDTEEFNRITKDVFRLNYIVGNIVVIVDAIEEIASALNDRFDSKLFFESLKILHERFLSTKIILTTREHFLPRIQEFDSSSTISYYQLQGFKESDLSNFLNKRYQENSTKIREVRRFILEGNLFQDEHIIPLFVDLVCSIIDRPEQVIPTESQYFIVQEAVDKLLINLLVREIVKQSLNITIDGMFVLLEEITLQHNGSMKKKDFDENVEILSGQSSEKYIINPLFIFSKESIRLKYDILSNFVKARVLRHSLLTKTTTAPKVWHLLKDCYKGQGDVFLLLINNLTKGDDVKGFVREFVQTYTKLFEREDNEIEKENLRRSISALLYILDRIEKPRDRQERMQLIREVYNLNVGLSLRGLSIYGDFEALDFSAETIGDSYFYEYGNFYRSRFPEEERMVFYNTDFVNFDIPASKQIKRKYFDDDCRYMNCNIGEVTSSNFTKEEKRFEQLRGDIISIARYIDTSQRSLHLIKRYCNISYAKGPQKFLEELHSKGFLEVEHNGNNKHYKINRSFHNYVPLIKLGNFPAELDLILKDLM